jgi:hypothetical protein
MAEMGIFPGTGPGIVIPEDLSQLPELSASALGKAILRLMRAKSEADRIDDAVPTLPYLPYSGFVHNSRHDIYNKHTALFIFFLFHLFIRVQQRAAPRFSLDRFIFAHCVMASGGDILSGRKFCWQIFTTLKHLMERCTSSAKDTADGVITNHISQSAILSMYGRVLMYFYFFKAK